MIGAIAGDIIGSVYEHHPIKTTDFPLFDRRCRFTDDTVLTLAVADALLGACNYTEAFRSYYARYPNAGYGKAFHGWARSVDPRPYGSFGNGSAMRVSAVAFAFHEIGRVRSEARRSAEVTHNHPEGIKGAEAVASAVFLARMGTRKDEIRAYVEREFLYDLGHTPDEIRPSYSFDVTCQGTVPAALSCFLHATGYEDAVRQAISLGGDADTLACITGAISGAYDGVPASIEEQARSKLDRHLLAVLDRFTQKFCSVPQ